MPAPRGTIGMPAAAHAVTTAATSAVLCGRTRAIGCPASAHSAVVAGVGGQDVGVGDDPVGRKVGEVDAPARSCG